jgi:hypothetical protein
MLRKTQPPNPIQVPNAARVSFPKSILGGALGVSRQLDLEAGRHLAQPRRRLDAKGAKKRKGAKLNTFTITFALFGPFAVVALSSKELDKKRT